MGKYSKKDDPGSVTHFQALSTAISATVGLGNIAGVAIAISLGGPGAVIWMAIAAFFGMSTKFSEVLLGQMYRRFSDSGVAYGGAFLYLKDGLNDINKPKLGKLLASLFSICCIAGAIGGGILFQANQSVLLITDTFSLLNDQSLLVSLVLATITGSVIIGGIQRIAVTAEKIVPIMSIIYISACLIIIISNFNLVPSSIVLMFKSAFNFNAAMGGALGALIQGFKRAAFSNEAGIGSAPIAHSTAKTAYPVRAGAVALLEPFIDTIIICSMTGLVVTITGSYINADPASSGILITSNAFKTMFSWFPTILSISAFLFAFSTMVTYSYYGEQAWRYLFKNKNVTICRWIFISSIVIGGVGSLTTIINLADLMFLSMSIPNIIGLYLLRNVIKREVDSYLKDYKSKKFKKNDLNLKSLVSNIIKKTA